MLVSFPFLFPGTLFLSCSSRGCPERLRTFSYSSRPRKTIRTLGGLNWQKLKNTGMAGSEAYPTSFLAVLFLNCCSWLVSVYVPVLVRVGCHNHRLGGLNNKFIFSFWRLKVWDRGINMVEFWWQLAYWFADNHLLTVSLHGREKARASSLMFILIRTLILCDEGPTLMTPFNSFTSSFNHNYCHIAKYSHITD